MQYNIGCSRQTDKNKEPDLLQEGHWHTREASAVQHAHIMSSGDTAEESF